MYVVGLKAVDTVGLVEEGIVAGLVEEGTVAGLVEEGIVADLLEQRIVAGLVEEDTVVTPVAERIDVVALAAGTGRIRRIVIAVNSEHSVGHNLVK